MEQSKKEPYVFTHKDRTVLFYIDNILRCFWPDNWLKEVEFKKQLEDKYEMRDKGDLWWFLSMCILRDRPAKKLWICQNLYIEKITYKFRLDIALLLVILIPVTPFQWNARQATKGFTRIYQGKVRLILYMATMTQPDVAWAAAELYKYLTNPSKAYMAAADQAIQYLYTTYYLAIEFDGNKDYYLVIASDTLFADNIEDQKSSQGYII